MLTRLPLELLDLCCFWAAAVPVDELGVRPLEADAVPSRPQQSSLRALALTSKALFPIATKYLYLAPYLETIENVERFVKTISQKPDVKECYLNELGRALTAPLNHRAAWYCGFVVQLTMLGWPAHIAKTWPVRRNWRNTVQQTGARASARLQAAFRSVLQRCLKLETVYGEPFGDGGFSSIARAAERHGLQVVGQDLPGIANGGARFLREPFDLNDYLGLTSSDYGCAWTNGVISWTFPHAEALMDNLEHQRIGRVTSFQLLCVHITLDAEPIFPSCTMQLVR